MHCVLEFNQPQWLKLYAKLNKKKGRMNTEKNSDKEGKFLHKLMTNAVLCKAIEHLRKRIVIRLIHNKEDHLKWKLKPNHLTQKNI